MKTAAVQHGTRARAQPTVGEGASLAAWLLAVMSSEVAIHGVGEAVLRVMPLFVAATVALAVLTVHRYRQTGLPHWLLAGFASALLTVNASLYAYTSFGVDLHDLHVASDTAALGTAFFLLIESVDGRRAGTRLASLAGLLSCCAGLLVLLAVAFGVVPANLGQLFEVVTSERTASLFALPAWLPLVGLLPAVAGLALGNETLRRGGAHQRGIGPLGTAARIVVGTAMVASVVQGHLAGGVAPATWALGVVGFPAVLLAGQWLLARRHPARLVATGPVGHTLNVGVFLALYLTPWYAPSWAAASDGALIFYGASMLFAAARGYAGCEVLAVSNWLLRRDDQVGCVVFWPVDQIESRIPRALPGDSVEGAADDDERQPKGTLRRGPARRFRL